MMRCVQIDDEVVVMSTKEEDGKVLESEMRIVPLFMWKRFLNPLDYD